jgi:lysophospholipid acyltransferase (LPLAT)-like uncharacterized protein
MKSRSRWLVPYLAAVFSVVIRLWLLTIRLRRSFTNGCQHPADPASGRYMYAFWHEGLVAPLKVGWQARVLISEHTDGEIITLICKRFGIGAVRGSNTRGGGRALLEMIRDNDGGHLAVTPDGPKGPRRKLKPGVIMAAAHAEAPIIPFGIGYTSAWRCSSWDQLALPLPGSTMVMVFGEPIAIPKEIERRHLRQWTEFVEQRMTQLTEEAEAWAARLRRDGSKAAPPVLNPPAPLRQSA